MLSIEQQGLSAITMSSHANIVSPLPIHLQIGSRPRLHKGLHISHEYAREDDLLPLIYLSVMIGACCGDCSRDR